MSCWSSSCVTLHSLFGVHLMFRQDFEWYKLFFCTGIELHVGQPRVCTGIVTCRTTTCVYTGIVTCECTGIESHVGLARVLCVLFPRDRIFALPIL